MAAWGVVITVTGAAALAGSPPGVSTTTGSGCCGGRGVMSAPTPLEAARAPEGSTPTSRAPVATPLRWAQTDNGSSPTN